ncbi:unnamed protein product [Rotaria socialis]|uniref:Uncharacterized protein n=1 Tax=Rotaria socialis TaxID=392032 RepID=A0A818UNS5_9BILA|nr:unnamed protein product [Rotaria socialis]CAF4633865.1 unnamed protein product [Rotaria socialis]
MNVSFSALLIDPNTDSSLFNAYPRRNNIQIIHDFIWSESAVQNIVDKYNVSKHFTILKLDIDSLSALSKLLKSFDYILLEVDFWDVIYIQREIAQSTQIQVPANDHIAYRHGFLEHSCLSYCKANAKLYNSEIENAIKTAWNESNFTTFMANVIDLFSPISLKTNGKHPYIISP